MLGVVGDQRSRRPGCEVWLCALRSTAQLVLAGVRWALVSDLTPSVMRDVITPLVARAHPGCCVYRRRRRALVDEEGSEGARHLASSRGDDAHGRVADIGYVALHALLGSELLQDEDVALITAIAETAIEGAVETVEEYRSRGEVSVDVGDDAGTR